MHHVLVSGAGTGLGLELAGQLLARGDTVHAAWFPGDGEAALTSLQKRHPARLHPVPLDLRDETSIAATARAVLGQAPRLDRVYHAAGIMSPHHGMERIGQEDFRAHFDINAIGPFLLTRAVLPALRAAPTARVVAFSSNLGSLTLNTAELPWKCYPYHAAKCALNMVMRMLAHELAPDGILVFAVHPGWVRTRMGGGEAPLDPVDAVSRIRETAETLGVEDSGGYFNPDGTRLPW